MAQPNEHGFAGVTYTVDTKPDPGARPVNNSTLAAQWVRDDMRKKEAAPKQKYS